MEKLFLQLNVDENDSNVKERELASKIVHLIKVSEECQNVAVITGECLEIDGGECNDSGCVAFEPLFRGSQEFFTHEYIRKVLDFVHNEKPSFKRVEHFFPRVKHRYYISRSREYDQKCGTDRGKFEKIRDHVWSMARKAREDRLEIHDLTMKKWALMEVKEINFQNSSASPSLILEFKRTNNIVDRKITKFTCAKPTKTVGEIENEGLVFHKEFVETITPFYQPSQILNADKSGINYENMDGEHFLPEEKKSTETIIQSFNSFAHSYIIMPLLSMEGELLTPMLICLQRGLLLKQVSDVLDLCSTTEQIEAVKNFIPSMRPTVLSLERVNTRLISTVSGSQGATRKIDPQRWFTKVKQKKQRNDESRSCSIREELFLSHERDESVN